MAGGINKLTANQCKAAAKASTACKLYDGHGMFLHIRGHTATWRIKYRLTDSKGKRIERVYTIGNYPGVSLADAREELPKIKKLLSKGIDPVAARRVSHAEAAQSSEVTFEKLAKQWLKKSKPDWSEIHYKKSKRALERDIYPALGDLPITHITTRMVAAEIEKIDDRAPETARRIQQHVRSVFQMAQVKGLRTDNPVIIIKGKAGKKYKQPAITDLPGLGKALRDAEAAAISPVVRMASWLLAHTVVRPGELIGAKWSEFHLDAKLPVWVVPRSRMKVKSNEYDHTVPLPRSVVARLKEWQRITGGSGFVFKSDRSKTGHISVEALEKCYRETLKLRNKHVPHGWRAAFSTNANDAINNAGERQFEADVVEACLDHVSNNKVRAAYDRGKRWNARCELMKWWAGQLQQAVKNGADVVPLRARV